MSAAPRQKPTQTQIPAAGNGDIDALQPLIVAHHAALWRIVDAQLDASTRRWFDADDILQLTYIDLAASFEACTFSSRAALHAWLETAALHRLADCRRAARARKRDVRKQVGLGYAPRGSSDSSSFHNLARQFVAEQPTPSREIVRDEAKVALMMALARLSEEHRTVIQLRFLQARKVAQVATEMDRSEAAINQLTYRALTQLRKFMSALDISLSSF